MKKLLLFLLISSMAYSLQTHKDIDSASIPIQVNVYVVPDEQQLTIVNEQGIQQDAIVINHFVTPDFQGENTAQATFYVQRGANEQDQINLSSGSLDITMEREDVALNGSQVGALDSELVVEKPQAVVTDGTNRIQNRITSRIRKNPNAMLNPSEEYSGDTNMTVVWRK